jgi:hypothetical protein
MNLRSFLRRIPSSIHVGRPRVVDIVGPAIGALAVGLLAGAGLALLLAPMTGGELRERLESKLSGAKTRLLPHGEYAGTIPENRANAASSLEHRHS